MWVAQPAIMEQLTNRIKSPSGTALHRLNSLSELRKQLNYSLLRRATLLPQVMASDTLSLALRSALK
jgi:hypothetical protein